MSELAIPFALDPHGVEVPITEATRGRIDYYRCPVCGNWLTPFKGAQRKHHYRHKAGVLDDDECELSAISDINRMVDDLRTSDIEKVEQERNIRVYIGEEPGGRHRIFGVIPSADWDQISVGVEIDSLIQQISVTSTNIIHPPTSRSFHPSEAEVTFKLDPDSDKYEISIDAPDELDIINGTWTANGVEPGDLFVGDQTRARRASSKRQIKTNEWVYGVTSEGTTIDLDEISSHRIGDIELLSFPAREDTADVLNEFGLDLRTDEYGFDADVILPTNAHPTADKPIHATPGEPVLIGVTPSKDLDPVFEIVSVPRAENNETVELEQTGPGNTRFYKTKVPTRGSRRISVHQRNSNRHRLVHLHAVEPKDQEPLSRSMYGRLGLKISLDDTETLLSPLAGDRSYEFDGGDAGSLAALPAFVDYIGPQGLELEIEATFPSDAAMGSVHRSTTDLQSELTNVGHWVSQGCTNLTVTFDGIGDVELTFPDQRSEVSK